MEQRESKIQVRDLSKHFGDLVVLDPFSVDPTSVGDAAAVGASELDGADATTADAPAA